MDNRIQEVMDILQEECAEVIQIVSKIRRFGIDENHWKNGGLNREHLEGEIGDVLAMFELLKDMGVVNSFNIEQAKLAKFEKLKVWSNIYKNPI